MAADSTDLLPTATDVRRACSAVAAYAQGNLRETAIIVKDAGEEGRSFWMVLALLWLMSKLLGLSDNPQRIAQLQNDIAALLAVEDE